MAVERSYLDHNATSPLRPEARTAMLEAMDLVGNPSSVHAEGRAAKALMERARRQVASLCGAKPDQVVFTSGGTEANALALAPQSYEILTFDEDYEIGDTSFEGPRYSRLCVMSGIEHDSMQSGGRYAEEKQQRIDVRGDGITSATATRDAIRTSFGDDDSSEDAYATGGSRFLVTVMSANNETGVVQPIADIARVTHQNEGSLHSDAVQRAGKYAMSFIEDELDLASISAHKMGGPKGAGVVLTTDPDAILDDPLLTGGGQERGMRAGTENLIGIAGFGAAAEAAERDLDEFAKLADWRDEIEVAVARQTSDAVVIAQSSPRLPNTSCIALPGVSAETLVMALDLEGVAVSAGSACSSGKVTRSHVLEAMGLPDELTGSAIRISLGWNSSKKDVDHFVKAWSAVTDRLSRT